MQLITDLSDVPRYANLLTPYYKEKLVDDINGLLIKYMDEQTKVQAPPPVVQPPVNNFQAPPVPVQAAPPPSNFPPPVPQNTAPPPIGGPLFKTPFGKPGMNVPPPPPPPLGNLPPGGSPLKVKSLLQKVAPQPKAPRTSFISIFESLGHVIPDLNEKGKAALENLPSTSDAFKYIKQVDGSTNLKQIYMMVYPSTVTPINFIEKTMEINEPGYFKFVGSGNFPKDADAAIRLGEVLVALGYLDESTIEPALLHQRREVKVVTDEEGEIAHYDAKEARKEENKNIKREKPLLGDILVDMKIVTYQQVVYALRVQKWYRDILESVR